MKQACSSGDLANPSEHQGTQLSKRFLASGFKVQTQRERQDSVSYSECPWGMRTLARKPGMLTLVWYKQDEWSCPP